MTRVTHAQLIVYFAMHRFVQAAFLALLLTACSHLPSQEMSNARQAIQAARDAGAPSLAPGNWDKAQTAMHAAERALRSRSYSKARIRAEQAKKAAIHAREQSLTAAPQ